MRNHTDLNGTDWMIVTTESLKSVTFLNVLGVLIRLTGLWMAVVGVVLTLAGPAASAAEVEEAWVAFITLWSIHSHLALTYP